MEITRSFKKVPRLLAAAAMMSTLTVGAVALTGAPASATVPATWSVSNNATSDSTNQVNNYATYTWNFLTSSTGTPTTGTPTTITATVPANTALAATPTVTVLGLPGAGCSGTAALDPATWIVTVTLSSCAATGGARAVSLSIGAQTGTNDSTTGFTNTSTAGSSSSIVNVTYSGGGLDTFPASNSIGFQSNATGIKVVVPESLTFTNGGPPTVTLLPVPGVVATGDSTVPLKVITNANGGYKLSGCVTSNSGNGLGDPNGNFIANALNSGLTTLPITASAFAAQASISPGNITATLNGDWAGANGTEYLGYATTCGTSGNDVISQNTKPTSSTGDVLTLTNAVMITGSQPAGTYTGTVDYLVTPSY
jgi:hypothetical protein